MRLISAASFSRYKIFSQCRYRAKLAYIEKIPEPDRGPPPKGKKEWANDRGSRIHDEVEQYVRGTRMDIPTEAKNHRHEIERLRVLFKAKQVQTEETWFFDCNWAPTDGSIYKDIWLRIICDVTVWTEPTSAVIIDYKTGAKFGNEVSHAQQLQLYQLAAFMKYPKLEQVTAEIWYLDQDDIVSMSFRRSQGLRFYKLWDKQFSTMLDCTNFPPNGNQFSCKWCPYRQDRSGDCSFGVYY